MWGLGNCTGMKMMAVRGGGRLEMEINQRKGCDRDKEALIGTESADVYDSTEIVTGAEKVESGGKEDTLSAAPIILHRTDEVLSVSNKLLKTLSFDSLAAISPVCLKSISLASNQLVEVDLSALSLCSELTSLCMNANQLKNVCLEPLARCPKLEKLWLHNNKITNIDLTPLGECASFRSLYLDNNAIDEVSLHLDPLRKCRLLKSLRLSGNRLNGQLDVTPLLDCQTLTVFTYSGSTELLATYSNPATQNLLPPALRKRNVSVHWKEKKVSKRSYYSSSLGVAPTKEVRYYIALVGFRKRHSEAAEALLGYDPELDVKRIATLDGTGITDLAKADLVLVRAHAEVAVREIRARYPKVPIAVCGPTSEAEVAGSCLRHGANIFLREPLCGVSVLTVRDLVEKSRKPDEEEGGMRAGILPKPDTPLSLLTESGSQIDFDKIRTRYYNRQLNRLGRCHLEESALGMLFSRQGGYARESDFASISTLCGLPLSAAQAFFRAVSGWKEPLEAEARRISKGDFASFWRDNIRNFQAEARLFNVLRRKGESRVRTAAIASVVKGILSPPGNDQDMIELATAMLSFSVNGKADGYTLSEAKNAKICASLIAAEGNMHTGVTLGLKEESLNVIREKFREAGQHRSDLKGPLKPISLSDLLQYHNSTRSALTATAIRAAFAASCGDEMAKMSIGEFVRLQLAASNPSSVSAVNYFFKVMDADLDGCLSAGDLAPLYWGRSRQGFETFWTCAKDMTRCSEDGISARDLRLLPASSRAAFLQTILFHNEESTSPFDEWDIADLGCTARGG